MGEDEGRHELFERARKQVGFTVTQLWVDYLALGGSMDLFSVEAYLHGLAPLPPAQQDVLANVLNEGLDDLCRASKVPYIFPNPDLELSGIDPVDVLDELLRGPPQRD